ncbi:hypothetical protein AKJ09_11235 [Labilithrix luteola]|uniref:Ribbon-helix-helix protein CopG domain-containing protein n=1 Tax=Labilithrix luteola TaxID=1391654 RepID=A0A0K1QFY5_9BACT|nr:hypothetical protein [Labilithrix luteola]AKV04572.1 hypothetical protein AKJ09_11235 [Labilithrix luteola]
MAPRPPSDRNERLNVRIALEEMDMIQMLADDAGLNVSDFIRSFIRTAYRERFGDTKPKPR